MKRELDIQFRLATNDDVDYIFKRSLRDLRNSPMVHGVGNDLYYQYMHRAFEHTLTRCPVTVAHRGPRAIAEGWRTSSPDKILGYIVADPTNLGLVIHYMNVRRSFDDSGNETENFRQEGIATKLITHMREEYGVPQRIIYTLKTPMFRYEHGFKTRVENDPDIQYNPFLFFTLLPGGWETGIRRPSQQHYASVRP